MSSTSAVVCREVFDENSQPSAEEISEYAQQLGIDPESESHLLPLARDGLMQALPPPWKAYFDEKLQTHYYYNKETKKTQWDHPLDNIYRELVKRARDASMQDDTCASVQELLTSEENTKNLERVETKVESDDDELTTDSENQTDVKDTASATLAPGLKRLNPLGRPPLAPLARLDKKLNDLRISPLRRSMDSPLSNKPNLVRNISDRDLLSRPSFERPKQLFKQQSEIIDLKMHVLTSPEEENFSPLLSSAKVDKGLPLTGKGSMFLKLSKSDFPSPDTEKSLPLDSMTKSDPPKGILREKISDALQRKADSVVIGKSRHAASFEEDRKSVRFKLENLPEPTISPGSNSSSEQNDGQSSIISAAPVLLSPVIPSSPLVPPLVPPIPSATSSALSPLLARPPLPPRPVESPREARSASISEKESVATSSMALPPLAKSISPKPLMMENPKESKSASVSDKESTSTSSVALSPIPEPFSPKPMTESPRKTKDSLILEKEAMEFLSKAPVPPLSLSPLTAESPREAKSTSKDSMDSDSRESRGTSPRRRVLRPPAGDYIKPDLFQKNFQKISDLVRPGDIETTSVNLEEPSVEKEARPRSPMIPQKSKISINLMESIESETSIDSPDREFANFDLNDLDDSNDMHKDEPNENIPEKDIEKESLKDIEIEISEKTSSHSKMSSQTKSRPIDSVPIPQIKVPNLDFISKQNKLLHSDSDDSKKSMNEESKTKSVSVEIHKAPQLKVSPTPSFGSDMRSPREFNKPWSPLSSFKPLNKAVIAPQIKTSDSASSLGKSLASPRLDGVILSQGKSTDNVVVVYQFETQENSVPKTIKSPMVPDMGTRDMIERTKGDERRRLELSLQKELENMRLEWTSRERRMRAELQEEMREAEDRFLTEKRVRLAEQIERHKKEMEEALQTAERNHEQALQNSLKDLADRFHRDTETAARQYEEKMMKLKEEYNAKLAERKEQLEIENERALSDLRDQLQTNLHRERAKMVEENRATIDSLREEHTARITELRHDYRAEVERLRTQHACHLEELRARLASERAASSRHHEERAMAEKYKCLKEKYARLKHDVKMSIERRNKRREMSMTTGSETEKSNSHKATQERCKELNEKSSSIAAETDQGSGRANNNPTVRYNDNETSQSETHKSCQNNNHNWNTNRENTIPSADTSQISAVKHQRPHRRTAVAFKEPLRRRRDRDRDAGATTDCQDSSDATTADEKPKEAVNGHGRRRCFTRLKSASTSRLNYSPKRGEGWSSPLESLRQQLRKLDDLEDQFPDLAMQPAYSLRYPFTELGAVTTADTPELEFVRHRALVEREGMRRARAVLKRRRAALRETRASLSPHRAPSEEREATELEVALHRARALLGEKEIRLRHIERALRRLADSHPPPLIQEATTSEASSGSEAVVETEAGGAVLRSLRALHADVRDIWRALDARRPYTASPETSSCNAPSTSQTRMTLSAPEPIMQDNSDGGVAERARGLRAWLQTAP